MDLRPELVRLDVLAAVEDADQRREQPQGAHAVAGLDADRRQRPEVCLGERRERITSLAVIDRLRRWRGPFRPLLLAPIRRFLGLPLRPLEPALRGRIGEFLRGRIPVLQEWSGFVCGLLPGRRVGGNVGGEWIVESGLAAERIRRRALGRERVVARRPGIGRLRFVRLCIGDRRRVVRRFAIGGSGRSGGNGGRIVAPLHLRRRDV